jgi:hypothetical protein
MPRMPVNECLNYPNYPIAGPHTSLFFGWTTHTSLSTLNTLELLLEPEAIFEHQNCPKPNRFATSNLKITRDFQHCKYFYLFFGFH